MTNLDWPRLRLVRRGRILSTPTAARSYRSDIMRFLREPVLIGILALGAIAPVLAGPEPISDKTMVAQPEAPECNWYVSIGGGVDLDYGGTDFIREHNIPGLLGLATFHVPARTWDDAFDLPYRIQAELGYALGQHIELFGRFTYNAADGQTTNGSFISAVPIGTIDLRDKWDDYRSYGGEIGLRYLFLRRDAIVRPYISLSGGVTHVDSIGVTVRAANTIGAITAGDVLYDGKFYGSSTVATGSILAGLEVRVTRCFSVGTDAGLRYESKLADDDGDFNHASLAGFGFTNLNKVNDNAGDRLFCPVTLYAKIRF
jgi:hypothetical protein